MTSEDIVLALVEARHSVFLTQKKIARATGIPYGTIAGVESGKHRPNWDFITKYAKACGYDIEAILTKTTRARATARATLNVSTRDENERDALIDAGSRQGDEVDASLQRKRDTMNVEAYRAMLRVNMQAAWDGDKFIYGMDAVRLRERQTLERLKQFEDHNEPVGQPDGGISPAVRDSNGVAGDHDGPGADQPEDRGPEEVGDLGELTAHSKIDRELSADDSTATRVVQASA